MWEMIDEMLQPEREGNICVMNIANIGSDAVSSVLIFNDSQLESNSVGIFEFFFFKLQSSDGSSDDDCCKLNCFFFFFEACNRFVAYFLLAFY